MKNKLYILLFLSTCMVPEVLGQSAIHYDHVRITRKENQIEISFDLSAGRKSVGRNERLLLMPILYNDSLSVSLPAIAIQSRRMALLIARESEAYKRRNKSETPDYLMGNGDQIQYNTSIPYEEGLESLFLRMERSIQTCCNENRLSSIQLTDQAALVPEADVTVPVVEFAKSGQPTKSVADSLSKLYSFIAPIADFEQSKQTQGYKPFDLGMPLNMGKGISGMQQSAVEQFVASNEKGAIQINFSRNSSTIDRYFRGNNSSLVLLASTLREIQASNNSSVAKIVVAGFASPEGPLDANDRLAWERADAVRSFIRNNSNVQFNEILLYNGSEDWRGLRELVEESDIESKYEILYIIDHIPILSGREKQLMDLANGRPYKFMLRYFFPKLRNAAYIKVYYTNKLESGISE